MSMPEGPDALSVAFRAVSFVLLLTAVGIPIFIAAFGRHLASSLPAIRRLGWKVAVGALVFVAAHHALEAARMAGDMSGVMDPAMQKMAMQSPAGAAFALRIAGLVLVAVGLGWAARRHHAGEIVPGDVPDGASMPGAAPAFANTPLSARGGALAVALVGTLLATVAFTVTGHTSVTAYRAAAAVLLMAHLLVVAFWLGALWPLYLAAKKETPAVAGRLIDAFSVVAAWVVPFILLAGVGLTALLVPGLAVFRQPYGQLLLTKVALFALLMAMAALNKYHFGPACAAGDTAAFRRTVVVEYLAICVVLAVTATMTTFYSPEAA